MPRADHPLGDPSQVCGRIGVLCVCVCVGITGGREGGTISCYLVAVGVAVLVQIFVLEGLVLKGALL